MSKRRSLVITYKQESLLNSLRDVHIYYTSKRYNYAIIYTNQEKLDGLVKYLNNNSLVLDVNVSDDIYEF